MTLLRRILVAAITLFVAWQLFHGARAARFEYAIFRTPRSVPSRPPDAEELGLRDVEFPSADGTTLKGWYLPSSNGAAMVVVGGSASTRDGMLDHARLLHAGGTGVLLFDWPGCGESGGQIGVGPGERAAVSGAIGFVAQQPDVRDGRIGLLGFSLGAHMSFFVAAADSRVRMLVVEGVFSDPWKQGLAEYRHGGVAAQWGALFGDLLGGMDRKVPDAAAAAAGIAPRPFLVVAGGADPTVPVELSRQIFDLAREPKSFWLIEGAGHGEYLTADPTYGPRLRQFVEGALAATDGRASTP